MKTETQDPSISSTEPVCRPRNLWVKGRIGPLEEGSRYTAQILYCQSFQDLHQRDLQDFPGGTVKNPRVNVGRWVWFRVREDSTCWGATKPMHQNYWALALEPVSCNYWSLHIESLCSATEEATTVRSLYHNTDWPPLVMTWESPSKARKTQTEIKINKIIKKGGDL